MKPRIATRPVTSNDLDTLIADVQAGFDSYRAFAPKGWEPPELAVDREITAELLDHPATWALLALVGEQPAGHVAFFPGRERASPEQHWRERPLVPGLAHLWQLFVLPRWWGRGVAPLLHDAAVAEMRAQDYESARLFTPSLHARARRFYERRAWTPVADAFHDGLALMLTEYALLLRGEE